MRMRTTAFVSLAVIVLGLAVAAFTPRQSVTAQQREPKSWSQVQVVTYSSGLTGFFDTKTGKLYLYDANLHQPVIIRQVNELGKPLKRIKN